MRRLIVATAASLALSTLALVPGHSTSPSNAQPEVKSSDLSLVSDHFVTDHLVQKRVVREKVHTEHRRWEKHLRHVRHVRHERYVRHQRYLAHLRYEAHLRYLQHLRYEKHLRQQQAQVTQAATPAPAPAPSTGGAQAVGAYQSWALAQVGATQFSCLQQLWNRESGWSPTAQNPSSGAYGIPQSLPASKMAAFGSDYLTNGYTQMRWGLSYINSTYGSACNAWAHSQATGWY